MGMRLELPKLRIFPSERMKGEVPQAFQTSPRNSKEMAVSFMMGNTSKKGSRTERLARPRRIDPPKRPPTVGKQTYLPGMNERYARRLKTPLHERSPGERGGHAGLVTGSARKALSGDVFAPLLDMAANSLNEETQMLAAPAMAALAGHHSNRKVLSSFGAVDVMLKLAAQGKSASVKADAWDTLHQLLLSAEAVDRFLELDGIAAACSCVDSRDARLQRKGAMAMERVLTKSTIHISERATAANVGGLCGFVCSGDAQASEHAGSALYVMAKSSVKNSFTWSEEALEELSQAVAKGRGSSHLTVSEGNFARKGHGLCLKALALLSADKKTCAKMAQGTHYLALLLKGLYEHGVEFGRIASSQDQFYARSIAQVGMACRTSEMMNDMEVLKYLSAALPRLLFALQQSIPKSSLKESQPLQTRTWSKGPKAVDTMLLPKELEVQHNITMIINRFTFCLAQARIHFFKEHFVPTLLDLSTTMKVMKVRQNATSCIFYLVQDPEVQIQFCTSRGPDGKKENLAMKLIKALEETTDHLVKLTLLRIIHKLVRLEQNVSHFHNADAIPILKSLIEATLQVPDDGTQFPLLKCAFCASDILYVFLGCKDEKVVAEMKEGGSKTWLDEKILDFMAKFGEVAYAAMTGGETKTVLDTLEQHRPDLSSTIKSVMKFKHSVKKKVVQTEGEDKLKKMFRKYDQDHSGSIDGDELYSLLRDLGHLCTRDEAMRIMSGMDNNGDGTIDLDEFMNWWNNAPFTVMFASNAINR